MSSFSLSSSLELTLSWTYLCHLLAHVINNMLWIVKSPFTTPVTLTDGRMYHIRLSSHFIVRYSRDTDRPTDVLYIHDSHTILTVYMGLAQARPNYSFSVLLYYSHAQLYNIKTHGLLKGYQLGLVV